jgi:hypothetical protein
LIPVNSWEEIPTFVSEAEEADFWDTHCFGPELLKQFRPAGPRGVFSAHGITPPQRTRH